MKKIILVIIFILVISINSLAQARGPATVIRFGTSDPATCQPSGANIFYRTNTGQLKVCTATNTWTVVGAPAGTVTTSGGTTNTLSKFLTSTTLGDSEINDDGSIVTINVATHIKLLSPDFDDVDGAPVVRRDAAHDSYLRNGIISGAYGGTGLDTTGSTGVPSLAAGIWSVNSTLSGALGGTGVANTGKTITIGGNVVFSGAFNPTFVIPSSSSWSFPSGGGTIGIIANRLDQNNASTTSAQFASIISDETGSGVLVFGTTPTFTTSIKTPAITVPSDSTTALQIFKADGSTAVVKVDTTNARVGINKTPGAFDLDVNGAVNFASTLAITGLVSLGSQQAKSIRLGQLLEIHATAQQGGMSINSWNSSASVAGIFDFNRSKSATYGTMTAVSANDSLGDFGFRGADGTNFINAAFIGGYADGAVSSGVVPGRIIFQTSTSGGVLTARWSIDSSGNLNGTTGVIGLGATGSFITTPDVAISRLGAGSAAIGTGAAGSFAGDLKLNNILVTSTTDSTTTTTGAIQVAGGAAIRKRVFIDGITASSGLQTAVLCQSSGGEMIADSVACLASSGRFKENIKPLISGLDEVMKLKPVSYFYKPEGIFAHNLNFQRERVGFIAEDIAKVDARFVGYEADGITPRTVSYEMIVPLLVKSIQELKEEVDRLKTNQSLLLKSSTLKIPIIRIGI